MKYKKGDWVCYVMNPVYCQKIQWSRPVKLLDDTIHGWVNSDKDTFHYSLKPMGKGSVKCPLIKIPLSNFAKLALLYEYRYGKWIRKARQSDFDQILSDAIHDAARADEALTKAKQMMKEFECRTK